MAEILTELSAPALVGAIEANRRDFWAYRSQSRKLELHHGPGLMWIASPEPVPFLNQVLHTRLPDGEADQEIGKVLAFFDARKVPMTWVTGPSSRPADLPQRLEHHGLTHQSELAGMAVPLTLLKDMEAPPGLVIRRADDVETLRQCLVPLTRGFAMAEDVARLLLEMAEGLGFDQGRPWRHYLGLMNGEPVAHSELFLGAGVAGIYGVTTVPEARRRGIGGAMTLAPLQEARALGYRVGVLHSTPMGLSVYRGLGFQEYCRLQMFSRNGRKDSPKANGPSEGWRGDIRLSTRGFSPETPPGRAGGSNIPPSSLPVSGCRVNPAGWVGPDTPLLERPKGRGQGRALVQGALPSG